MAISVSGAFLATASALAEPLEFVVTPNTPTLSHVALKLYRNPGRWKEIAEWNSIPAPYFVKLGQRLRIQELPPAMSALAAPGATASGDSYTVDQSAPNLGAIAVRLYGRFAMWKKIAEWNHIASDRSLRLGQVLHLEQPPTISHVQGNQALFAIWKKRLGLYAVGEGPHEEASNIAAAEPAKMPPPQVVKEPEQSEGARRELASTSTRPDQPVEQPKPEAVASDEVPDDEPGPEDKATRGAKDLFDQGVQLFEAKKYAEAIEKLRASREADSEQLPTWFYEIRAFRLMHQEEEAKKTATLLLEKRPDLKALPMFQTMFPAEPSSD